MHAIEDSYEFVVLRNLLVLGGTFSRREPLNYAGAPGINCVRHQKGDHRH